MGQTLLQIRAAITNWGITARFDVARVLLIFSSSNFWYWIPVSLAYANSLPTGEYSNLFDAAAFPSKSLSGKTSLPAKNSY